MELLKEYVIPFWGLKPGKHRYQFKIDREFFKCFGHEEFPEASIDLDFSLDKQSNMLKLEFRLGGTITLPCDRCMDELNLKVSNSQTLFIKFGSEFMEESEQVIIIPEQEHQIDISQYIYEFIILAFPSKRIHSEGECNQEVISRLESLQSAQKNMIDPRWKALENIKINL